MNDHATTTPVEIPGSVGEGGGQVLRTSLALAIQTGKAFHITNIRAKRKTRGLRAQHLACVRAAAEICGATVTGDEIGSGEVTFVPGPVQAGEYSFDIGTAGSTTLVLQTVLPPLLGAEGPSTVTITGGTHNPMAPPIEFLGHTFLPELKKMGAEVTLTVERAGFYPAGGGCIKAEISPVSAWEPYELLDGGETVGLSASVTLSKLPEHIAERELETIQQKLGMEDEAMHIVLADSDGPGNVVQITAEREHVTELFTGFGAKTVPAEKVAKGVARDYQNYRRNTAPVGEYLADQLLLPLAIGAGGRFRTSKPSQHTRTNAQVIQQFLPTKIHESKVDDFIWEVHVEP